jgi:CheY-like chemotaxis protein
MSDSKAKLKILVMDDDEDVRFIAEFMLQRLGFAVVLTSRGSEAIECYKEATAEGARFHAVILDINIPGSMGGREVVKLLHALDPQVHAFISSGNPFDPLMENPTDFGFAGAIAKPFMTDNLRILLPTDRPG